MTTETVPEAICALRSGRRTVTEVSVDLSPCPDWPSALAAAKDAAARSGGDMLRLTLTGEVRFDNSDLAADVEGELAPRFYAVSVKDDTRPAADIAALASDRSLKGQFVRLTLAAEGYSDEMKSRILSAGLKALSGRGDEL